MNSHYAAFHIIKISSSLNSNLDGWSKLKNFSKLRTYIWPTKQRKNENLRAFINHAKYNDIDSRCTLFPTYSVVRVWCKIWKTGNFFIYCCKRGTWRNEGNGRRKGTGLFNDKQILCWLQRKSACPLRLLHWRVYHVLTSGQNINGQIFCPGSWAHDLRMQIATTCVLC